MPLAGQLAHESYVRPGPLVLGTAFLRSPAAASDRDRHSCYRRCNAPGARAFLPGSACRHAGRTISSPLSIRGGAWRMVSEDSGSPCYEDPAFPADWPHLSHCHCLSIDQQSLKTSSAGFTRRFQHIAKFIDSAVNSLSHDVLNPARVPL